MRRILKNSLVAVMCKHSLPSNVVVAAHFSGEFLQVKVTFKVCERSDVARFLFWCVCLCKSIWSSAINFTQMKCRGWWEKEVSACRHQDKNLYFPRSTILCALTRASEKAVGRMPTVKKETPEGEREEEQENIANYS
jgi:hypothetical protein